MASKFWDDLKRTLKTGFNTAADKTEEYAKIGKIKVEIMNLKRTLDRHYTDLGKDVFEMLGKGKTEDVAGSAKVKDFISKIKALQMDMQKKDAEIEMVKKEHQKKPAAAPSGQSTPAAPPKTSGDKSGPSAKTGTKK